jgi:hypothetical protein
MASTVEAEHQQAAANDRDVPLCVALNGTLIRSDLLFESLLLLLKNRPLCLILIPFWLMQGRAVLKAEISSRISLDPAALPYNRELVGWLNNERRAGRHLWLCTNTTRALAEGVAAHLGVFDGVIACGSTINLNGSAKAQKLVARFGHKSFDYCGGSRRDSEVRAGARSAVLVRVIGQHDCALGEARALEDLAGPRNRLMTTLRALRPYQWIKNVLVLVPLLAAHRAGDFHLAGSGLLALGAFCLCASSVYVLNDLLDLEADRAHPRKRKRPFAAGDLSIVSAAARSNTPVRIPAAGIPARHLWVLRCHACIFIRP